VNKALLKLATAYRRFFGERNAPSSGSSGSAGSNATATTATIAPRRLVNRYRLEALIGEGGMGVVYAAADETLGRSVAVKLLRPKELQSGDGLERFQREARLAVSLSHPNIVTVSDFGVDEDGAPYLVMERLFGRSLRTALRVERRLPWDRTLSIVQGVASAIEAAHARGMVHCDLKPENIFLTRMLEMSRPSDSRGSNSNFASSNIEIAKVLDFGIATTPAVVFGTLAYMSPEQLAGGKPAPAWDVWGLAIIAYEMLSGAHPFGTAAGGGGMPIAKAVPIRSVARDLPAEVEAFFDRALALEPTSRPATASALADDFRQAISRP
jgi:serine/threonine protein kinase